VDRICPHNVGFRYALDLNGNTRLVNAVNQYAWAGITGTGAWKLYYQAGLRWFDARCWIQEAPVFCGPGGTSAVEAIGYLWGACLLTKRVALDSQGVDSGGQKWHFFCAQASTEYSLLVAVPASEN